MKIGSTLIIGAGGIGSHLAEPLARLLKFHANGKMDMTIVDGDVYEEGNLGRQMFSMGMIGHNKALVLSDRVASGIPLDETDERVVEVRDYINTDVDAAGLMLRTMPETDDELHLDQEKALLLCLCVDNDATRRLFYDGVALLPEDHSPVVIIDMGNELETASAVASIWVGRKSLLASPVECYENLRNPKDRIPGGGCMALAPSTPQLMVANMAAALAGLLIVQALLDGAQWTDVVQANIRKFSMGVAGGDYGIRS